MPEGWPGHEVAWILAREAWGKGYATEAATAAMDWAVDTLGWSDIIHVIDPANAASIAVATKLGSANRGPGQLPAPTSPSPTPDGARPPRSGGLSGGEARTPAVSFDRR